MAYYSKEVYIAKEKWALNKNAKNVDKAIRNGATKEQAEAISRLCSDRHYIHCYSGRVFFSETIESDNIGRMLCDEETSDKNINVYLTNSGLPPIIYTYNFIDDMYDDFSYQYCDLNSTIEEEQEKALKVMEQFDEDIINYIKEFDEKYNTSFAPTGLGRLDISLR